MKKQDSALEEETGCWVKFIFMGSCISSRSKVDSSLSSGCSNFGNDASSFLRFFLLFSFLCSGIKRCFNFGNSAFSVLQFLFLSFMLGREICSILGLKYFFFLSIFPFHHPRFERCSDLEVTRNGFSTFPLFSSLQMLLGIDIIPYDLVWMSYLLFSIPDFFLLSRYKGF